MARQAGALQARPMTLAVLTKRIQAAVKTLDLTVVVSREGDCLVVDLTGAICPDPLLVMRAVEAELENGSATAGLEAVKLYGYAPATEGVDSLTLGWMSVLDLDGYLARRAALPPQAFGLPGAEASRLACAAEREQILSRAPSSVLREADAGAPSEAETAAQSLEIEPDLDSGMAPIPGETSAKPTRQGPVVLELEDPWEIEFPGEKETYIPFSMEHFPRITQTRNEQLTADSGRGFELELDQKQAYPSGVAERAAIATAVASPRAVSSDAGVSIAAPRPRTYKAYLAFIADQSSWFAQTVKENPRLHQLAKQRQHRTLETLANYLAETLAQDENLVDLVPVRQQEHSCGLILTDQRAISLSQSRRRDRSDPETLQIWMAPWGWVRKVEISNNALCFHYGRAKQCFSADLEAPYHLRHSIPSDIPVRMVREITRVRSKTLETKAGLAMVAGVMFALGSSFSVANNLLQNQRLEQRSNAIALGRNSVEPAAASKKALQEPADTTTVNPYLLSNSGTTLSQLSVSSPLELTTSHEQCIESFNAVAEPHAYATLNKITQTLQVNFQRQTLGQIPPQQFNQMAASVANEILTSCKTKAISHVVVTNGTHRYQQNRSDGDLSLVTSG